MTDSSVRAWLALASTAVFVPLYFDRDDVEATNRSSQAPRILVKIDRVHFRLHCNLDHMHPLANVHNRVMTLASRIAAELLLVVDVDLEELVLL